MFKVNRGNNQFLYSETSVEPLHGWAKPNSDNKAITTGAYELTEIAELIKETKGNGIIEPDRNTMKCKMEIKQGAINFDVENSIASLLGFRKKVYEQTKYASQNFIDIKGFSTINIHCNVISGVKDNGNSTDIL